MASIKDLKKRIGTVKNTQQTTRAMKMVSAAKLRKSQDAILNHRPFALKLREMITKLSQDETVRAHHPLLGIRETIGEQGSYQKKTLLVIITSDRGLCGAFNGSVIKAAQRWLQSNTENAGSLEFSFVGKRGYDFFKTKKINSADYYQELGGKVTFQKAKKLAEHLVHRYLEGEVSEIKIIFNEFKNAASQRVVIEDFLPIRFSMEESSSRITADQNQVSSYIVKPSIHEVLRELLEKNFAVQAFRILLESQAGEHGARMSAMENATKNAGEMIRKLTLQFNKQRQAGITKELLEIIAGSESQKGK